MTTKAPVTVVGGGVMGCGIALSCALGGRSVRLVDTDDERLARTRAAIAARVEQLGFDRDRPLHIHYTTSLEDAVRDTAAVFEAVPDELELKREIFARLDEITPVDVPLATNSGNLAIDEIAPAVRHPSTSWPGRSGADATKLAPNAATGNGDSHAAQNCGCRTNRS